MRKRREEKEKERKKVTLIVSFRFAILIQNFGVTVGFNHLKKRIILFFFLVWFGLVWSGELMVILMFQKKILSYLRNSGLQIEEIRWQTDSSQISLNGRN